MISKAGDLSREAIGVITGHLLLTPRPGGIDLSCRHCRMILSLADLDLQWETVPPSWYQDRESSSVAQGKPDIFESRTTSW